MGPCPRSVPTWRAHGVRRIPEPGRSAHSKSGNVSGAILLRAAWPTICSSECRKNIRMREMLSFLLKAYPLPEFLLSLLPNISRHRWTLSQNGPPCARDVRPVGPEGVERGTCDVRLRPRPSFRSREKVVVESSSFSLPPPSYLLPSFFFASCVVWSEI